MTFINDTFGYGGAASIYFAGQWWMVGLFLIIIFGLYLYGSNISREGLILFVISAFLLTSINNIFQIPQEYQLMIVIPIIIFIGLIFYSVINRWDK